MTPRRCIFHGDRSVYTGAVCVECHMENLRENIEAIQAEREELNEREKHWRDKLAKVGAVQVIEFSRSPESELPIRVDTETRRRLNL